MKDPWNDTTDSMEAGIPEEALSDRDRVTVTMKGGAGFDAPWIVIHAKDVDEANKILDDTDQHGLVAKVISRSRAFADYYGPSKASGSPANGFPRGVGTGYSQPVQQAPSGAPTASCPVHGSALVYNQPFSSGNKQISGRMACPERGCRAITIWHNKDGSWKQG
jgi:hypothetical protein